MRRKVVRRRRKHHKAAWKAAKVAVAALFVGGLIVANIWLWAAVAR